MLGKNCRKSHDLINGRDLEYASSYSKTDDAVSERIKATFNFSIRTKPNCYQFVIIFVDYVNLPDGSDQLTRSHETWMSVITTECFQGQKSRIFSERGKKVIDSLERHEVKLNFYKIGSNEGSD